jgi:2-polyprenyl-3-methyl-5-hydroxy-6-metoxy-1,4-benzoquinol methylase
MYADENLNTYLTEEAEIRRALDFFAHIFERYLPQAFTEPGSLLDLGAGIGTLVYTARKFNWKAIGVELNRRSVDWAAERFGIELIQGDFYRLEEYFTRKSFDLISLNHVLEHVLQPRFFINYIADFLKPRGAILVSVPNILSDDFRRDGALWSYIHIPGHISYFSHFSMDALFLSGTQRPSPRFKKIFQTSFTSPSQHEGEGLTSLYQDTSHTSSASQ